ncbi:uncharacterized protein KGF55_002784 [Candida pseudojiufengensis]|uniref:uncharacterized protein n=1 Tax=Candida pseudojiufengensis TaxID=497109 RepID=UPI002225B322|nr:uncharacterized protein KGF55_002784 [Candida pseudojiufengensis]KAI5962992.1 hypothetical protein KGF55_002784 [Candida pseudojiufengensis]
MLYHEILPLELIEKIILEIENFEPIPKLVRQIWYHNVTINTLFELLVKHELYNLNTGLYKIYVNFDSKKYAPSNEFVIIEFESMLEIRLKSKNFKIINPFLQLWYGYETDPSLNFYLDILPFRIEENESKTKEIFKAEELPPEVDLDFMVWFLNYYIYGVVPRQSFEDRVVKIKEAKIFLTIDSFYNLSAIKEYQEWQPDSLDIKIKNNKTPTNFSVLQIKSKPFKNLRVFKFEYNAYESYLSSDLELGKLLGKSIEEVTIIMSYLQIKLLLNGFDDNQLKYLRIDSNLNSYGKPNSRKRATIIEMIKSKVRDGNCEMYIIDKELRRYKVIQLHSLIGMQNIDLV